MLPAAVAAAAAAAGCTGTEPAPQPPQSPDAGVVATVNDGDTLRLRDGRRVRLVQIDAPEEGRECYAEAATKELRRLAPPGSTVMLVGDPALDGVDEHGRLLRYVTVGDVQVNLELVSLGAAAPYFFRGDRGRHAHELLRRAGEAREAGRGMWGACPGARLEPGLGALSGPN